MGSVGASRGSSGVGSEATEFIEERKRETEDIFSSAETVDESLKRQLQIEMGQTGDEAGRSDLPRGSGELLYVKTSKAFNINAYLNSDGETIHSEHSSWDETGRYGRKDVEAAIKQIDAGMKPLTRDLQLTRFISYDSMKHMFGLPMSRSQFNTLLNNLETNPTAQRSFKDMLMDTDYTHKGYSSTTYTKDHESFGSRDIRLNVVMRKGTNAIITNNDAEHEILGGRGLKYNFTGGYKVQEVTDKYGRKRKQLVLDVIMG